MMRYLRALPKMALFATITFALYVLAAVGSPPVRWFGGSATRWRARLFRLWARRIAWTLGMRVQVEGRPPRAPFFLVSNHLSYVDVVLLASRLECSFVARSDVAGWPVVGALCRAANTVFVDRSLKRDVPRVIEQIRGAMERGVGVVVFPEGTSSAGREVLDFKPALLEAAARSEIPVCYASLSYQVEPAHGSARNDVCWWGPMTFADHCVRLFQLPRIAAFLRFGDEPIRHADRKVLAVSLHRAVVQQFRPVPS